MAKTLAYDDASSITVIKSFRVQTPEWLMELTPIGTTGFACDFHAETPSGFFRQFV